MALAYNAAQAASAQGQATTLTATYPSTPTQNDLLVCTLFDRGAPPTNPTDWTTAITVVDGGNNDTLRIIYKIAGASETTSVQWTSMSGSDDHATAIHEVSGNDTSSVLDKTASTAVDSGSTSISSGTTATLSQADEICFVAFSHRAATTDTVLSNSYTLTFHLQQAGANFAGLDDGYRIVAATTAQESTDSWTNTAVSMGAIATFKASGGTPATGWGPLRYGERSRTIIGSMN